MIKVQVELEIPPIGNVLLSLEDARDLHRQLSAVFDAAPNGKRYELPDLSKPWQLEPFEWPTKTMCLTGAVGE